jgi:hypothetical protein
VPPEARVVTAEAGIVATDLGGGSTARSVNQVSVVERTPPLTTCGSTSQSLRSVFQVSPSKTVRRPAKHRAGPVLTALYVQHSVPAQEG